MISVFWKWIVPVFGIWLLLPSFAGAQQLSTNTGTSAGPLVFPLDTIRQITVATIDLVDNSYEIQSRQTNFGGRLKQITANSEDRSNWNAAAFSVEDPLGLRQGDLILRYRLPAVMEHEYYEVKVAFQLNGAPLTPEPQYLRGDVGGPIVVRGAAETKRIVWTNLLENYINLEGELEVILTIVVNGMIPGCLDVDCTSEIPDFNRKPFLWAGLAGAALIGAGQIFDSQADDIYEDYANFKPSDNPSEDPEDLYEEANGKHHTYLALTYAGITVLAVDAAWLLIKELSYGRKRRLYRQCCRSSALQLRPVLDLPAGDGVAHLGLRVRLNF